jgi:hypothetical protein
MMLRCAACVLFAFLLIGSAAALAEEQSLRRATVWDLKLGAHVSAQPPARGFKSLACGSNGGPPRQQLADWNEFWRCRAEPNGLHEVYFEYDDELEYIARARDLEREITRWAGTTEAGFSVIVSALIDDAGLVRGIRIVTDSRPDYRNDITEANLRKRTEAYQFGALMAARYDIDAGRDCKPQPPASGESDLFIKQRCELADAARGRRIIVHANLFRKPGQSAVNPQLATQLTEGQFESSARLEIFDLKTP